MRILKVVSDVAKLVLILLEQAMRGTIYIIMSRMNNKLKRKKLFRDKFLRKSNRESN